MMMDGTSASNSKLPRNVHGDKEFIIKVQVGGGGSEREEGRREEGRRESSGHCASSCMSSHAEQVKGKITPDCYPASTT